MKTLVLILSFGITFCAYSQDKISISVSNFQKNIRLGEHFTLFFEVEDALKLESNYSDTLILPQNWQILTHKKTVVNKQITKYSFTISTSRNNNSAEYFLDFRLLSSKNLIAFKRVSIFIEEYSNVEIVGLTHHESAQEGTEVLSKFLTQNLGNKVEKIRLETSRGKILNKQEYYILKPDSSLTVYVQQTLYSTDQNFWQTSADLKVYVEGKAGPLISIIQIPVYSGKIKKSDPYLRFPIEVGAGYLDYRFDNKSINAYQYYANGGGFLDFGSKHYLNFSIRGPNQISFPALGNNDEMALSYSYKNNITLTLGDYQQRFTNLMEFGRYGRGIKIEKKIEKISFLAFYQKARFFPNQKDAFGGNISYHFSNRTAISLNFISKNLTLPTASFVSNILGASIDIKKDNFSLNTEIDLGEAQKNISLGFYNKFYLKLGRFQLNNEIVYADKKFYGFYNNSWLMVNGLNFYLTKKINVGISSNISRVNPSLDANLYSFSPFTKTYMGVIAFQPNPKNLFTFNFINQEREDRQIPSKFHYKEDLGSFSYNLNTNNFNLHTQSRYGFTRNLLTEDSLSKFLSYSNLIQPNIRLKPWLWFGGYLEHQYTRKFTNNNTLQNLVFYGGNLKINLNKNLNINILYRNNYSPDEFFEQRSFLDASLIYETKRHSFSINGGKFYLPNAPDSYQNTLFFTAKYTIKLNVPIVKNKKLGSISGQIIEMNKGIGREGMLIQLGEKKFLTDATGRFYFKDLLPDQYILRVSSNKPGVVTTAKYPIEVNVKADSTHVINIPFIKTGGIIGKVNFVTISKNSRVTNTDKPPVVLLTLYNDKENFTTQMNDKNEFSFKEMLPGAWKIKVSVIGNQQLFNIPNAEQNVEIEQGIIKEITFKIEHLERKIYFNNQNYKLLLNK